MVPRAEVAISSPNGVTRFCSATLLGLLVRLSVHRLGGGGRVGGRERVLQAFFEFVLEFFARQIARQWLLLLAAHARLHSSEDGRAKPSHQSGLRGLGGGGSLPTGW